MIFLFEPNSKFLFGDNLIQSNSDDAFFKQFFSIDQLGGQSGWSGLLFFNATSGDYLFWTIHTAGGTEECDPLSCEGIHLILS